MKILLSATFIFGIAIFSSPAFGGTVITTNLPANTVIINISGTQDGSAGYNSDQSLWYQPFNTTGMTTDYTISAGKYYFRVVSPADAAKFFPNLTPTQTNQIYSGWTYNSPWIENYLIFDRAATNNSSLHQIIYGAPSTTSGYANSTTAYQAAISTGVYNQLYDGDLGSDGSVSGNHTFTTNETLVFVIPDSGLGDNGGGVSVLISPIPYNQNLLLNPGAEAGSLTNWEIGGVSNPTIDTGTFDSGINPHSGGYDFRGGNGTGGSLAQVVALVGNQGLTSNQLDSGALIAQVSFWEQGLNQGPLSDNAYISLAFWNGASNIISTVSNSVVDSHEGVWSNSVSSFNIPNGTRYIEYKMNFVRESGSDLDAFVDDNRLTISDFGALPRLNISNSGANNITLQWPTNATGFILSQTTNLQSAVWSDINLPLTINNSNYTLTLPLDTTNRFFRLHNP